MADTSLFSRLQRLFSTNVIVRNVGGRKLKISDTSRTQATAKSNLVDRYQKIFTGAGLSGYSDALMTKSMRLNLFKDYEQMDSDSEINAALDILAEISTQRNTENETPFDIVFKDEKRDFVPIYSGKIKQLNYIKTFLSKHLY